MNQADRERFVVSKVSLWVSISLAVLAHSESMAGRLYWHGQDSDFNNVSNWTTDPSGTVPATTFQSADTLLFSGTGSGSDAACSMTGTRSASVVDFTNYSGTFSFGTHTLSIEADLILDPAMVLSPGIGSINLIGSGQQSIRSVAGLSLPDILKSGSGALTQNSPIKAEGLTIEAGSWDLNGQSLSISSFQATGGALDLGEDSLRISGNADFTGLGSLQARTGHTIVESPNATTVTLTPGSHSFHHLILSCLPATDVTKLEVAPGTLKVLGNLTLRWKRAGSGDNAEFRFRGPADIQVEGYVRHLHSTDPGGNSGRLRMDYTRWDVKGEWDFDNWYLPVYTGSRIEFSGTGTQLLHGDKYPYDTLVHSGPGTLQLVKGDLRAKKIVQSGGSLDFNGKNLIVSTGGDFVVNNGTSATFVGLAGRTLSIGGNAHFQGSVGSLLGLDPGGTWFLSVAGTLSASYARIANNDASSGSPGSADSTCADGGGNINWGFNQDVNLAITSQPLSQSAKEGEAVSFSVSATGQGSLGYQWRRNGVDISGAVGSTYSLTSATLADDGALYSCLVSDSKESILSSPAMLTVEAVPNLPVITMQPQNQAIAAGGDASFKVSAQGEGISYQWHRGAAEIDGAVDSVYTLAGVTGDDDGAVFRVVVSNQAGSLSSQTAALTVSGCAETFSAGPDTTVAEGDSLVLTGVATCTSNLQWLVIDGPTDWLVDPFQAVQRLKAPRVAGDTSFKISLNVRFGSGWKSIQVTVGIRESIPEPEFALSPIEAWNGNDTLTLEPVIENLSQMEESGHSVLGYRWILQGVEVVSDTSTGRLKIWEPRADGTLNVQLCVDNAGPATCREQQVSISRMPTSRIANPWPKEALLLRGIRLIWRQPAKITLFDSDGRILELLEGRSGHERLLQLREIRALRQGRFRVQTY